MKKAFAGVSHSSKGLRATPTRCARAHPVENELPMHALPEGWAPVSTFANLPHEGLVSKSY